MKLDKRIELPAYGGNNALVYNLPISDTFVGEVQVWYVPKAYSADGWFVSCTPANGIPEYPAVSPAEAHLVMKYSFKRDDADNEEENKPSTVDPYSIETPIEIYQADAQAIKTQLFAAAKA
jgi:hypothetical protein